MKPYLEKKVYHADLYVRLSQEDGDKEESDSITNQKELILSFVETQEDIQIHTIRVDDGYSGVDFQRPAFQQMLEDIKKGEVDCVITKDLSRFGRNHIEVGKYIERIFPYLGVRFIAINDHYDSLKCDGQGTDIIIPFKNLINDAYCRDISMKIRSSLEVKRKKGDYVGAFAPYGYEKSKTDKNKLVVDEEAAEVIRYIFQLYLQGYSAYKIAEKLNERAVLTPMDHKREHGSAYRSGFRRKSESVWDHVAVLRILKDPTCTGTVTQGKVTTPNYKVRKLVHKDESQWIRVEGVHEAIIPTVQFDTVQDLMQLDTRTADDQECLYPLSGLVRCGDCGANMARKTVPAGKKKFVYYICGANKNDKRVCSSHRINAEVLERTVFTLLQHQIDSALELDSLLERIRKERCGTGRAAVKSRSLDRKRAEVRKYHRLRAGLYEDYKGGLFTREEYQELKEMYEGRIHVAEKSVQILQEEIDRIVSDQIDKSGWLGEFKRHGHLTQLTREVTASLIHHILIYEKKEKERYPRIEVFFRYAEELQISMEVAKALDQGAKDTVPGEEGEDGQKK